MLKLSGALEQATWIAAGYWHRRRSPGQRSRALKVLKSRVQIPEHLRDAALTIAVDEQERLTEVGSHHDQSRASGSRAGLRRSCSGPSRPTAGA
jgi:hypothetical protein